MKGNRVFFVCFIFCSVVIYTYARGVDTNTQRISQRKCREYESIVNNMTQKQCFKPPQSLIVVGNGDPADAREFPHMAAIGYDESNSSIIYLCGGILISNNFVLTAAHCLLSRDYGPPKIVTVGDLVLNSDKDNARPENINIIKTFKHPDFKGVSKYNDIALLQLEKDVTFSLYAYPACLPESSYIEDSSKVIVTGWGYTTPWGEPSNALLLANLRIVPHAVCSNYYKPGGRKLNEGISNSTQICAATLPGEERKDTCNGDSGGPLQRRSRDSCIYEVLGVTSFGKTCLITDSPGVYTKIYPYLEWIESIVWP